MEHTTRKNNRLSDFDYSAPGIYYVTICTAERKDLFWEFIYKDDDIPLTYSLSPYGEILNDAINKMPVKYPFVRVDKYCIMPDHVHMIISFTDEGESSAALSTVIGQMKRWVAKEIGTPVWQKSFYDKIINSKKKYFDIAKYIDDNPKVYWKRFE